MSDVSLDLDAIKEREKAATPGPWTHGRHADTVIAPEVRQEPRYEQEFSDYGGYLVGESMISRDCRFIAHAREDIPALVAEVERLRSKLEDAADERERTVRRLGGDW